DTNRLFDINMSSVVFDEFHEFRSEHALFGAFIVHMKARNILCSNCKTLLLSATPSTLNFLWEGKNSKTLVLPNENEHYKAQHSIPYIFEFSDSFIESAEVSSLTMYCSIKNVQENYKYSYDHITHSRYNDNDKNQKIDNVKKLFGKAGDKNGTVISAPVLQASLDISFNSLYKTFESPEYDLQTFGRINRWGEIKTPCKIDMIDLYEDKGEHQTIFVRYDLTISKLWSKFLKENIRKQITLDEIYALYNEFNKKYKKELEKFIKTKYEESIKDLSTFFPIQRNGKKSNKIIGAKTLRNSDGSYFIVVKKKKDNKWCDFVFSVDLVDIKDIIDSNSHRFEKQTLLTTFENLEQITEENGEYKYDYSEIKSKFFNKKKEKRINDEDLKKLARCSASPLPCFNKKYCEILGLIDC
ncbi:MAG: CRISPR-associated nuclease/helicase Cas3 subtype, partial [Bacteroidota bacterium]